MTKSNGKLISKSNKKFLIISNEKLIRKSNRKLSLISIKWKIASSLIQAENCSISNENMKIENEKEV